MQHGGLGLNADPHGPFHGPLAHAYACGAHIQVAGGGEWNNPVGCACCGPEQKRAGLYEDWGIGSPDDWRRQTESLIGDRDSNFAASVLLELRRVSSQAVGQPIDPGVWRDGIAHMCWQHGIDEASYRQWVDLARLILSYEERFTADGLLPPGAIVPSIKAWDFGRGANMARWGVQCGYSDMHTSQTYAVHASEQARRHYATWAEFSASYILGRCLHFDNGEFGHWYTTPLDVHHLMMSHPQSPWLHVPFRG
ncbi:DUF1266 domain-containing protein [Streptomonospora salina]|uniref:DUF1266 domain-containing protein n=1 Tax=Streptomonospora salina TaxID=104205 RepID=A0A841EF97_9ACTN|nr:DUF1266 domain-containing protein [Streptomonospora salina]MBB5999568.1 hypothetical protein [Streptomonospora salina]